MTHDRREEYRFPADLVIDPLTLPGGQTLVVKGSIRELSASGCRVESAVDLEMGQVIELNFDLDGGHVIRRARARVVRRLSYRSRRVVAVQFENLPEEDLIKIREFIVWRETRELK